MTPAERYALDERLAAEPTPPKFGADWGANDDAQAGQDAALAMLGISLEELPA